jgi:hypothetical protein
VGQIILVATPLVGVRPNSPAALMTASSACNPAVPSATVSPRFSARAVWAALSGVAPPATSVSPPSVSSNAIVLAHGAEVPSAAICCASSSVAAGALAAPMISPPIAPNSAAPAITYWIPIGICVQSRFATYPTNTNNPLMNAASPTTKKIALCAYDGGGPGSLLKAPRTSSARKLATMKKMPSRTSATPLNKAQFP